MINLAVDPTQAVSFFPDGFLMETQSGISKAFTQLLAGTGKGNDFLGWIRLPSHTEAGLLKKLSDDAARIREIAELFVIVGIGGSYLGARAVIDALSPAFHSLHKDRKNPLILYAGQNLSSDYHAGLLEILDRYSYAVAVISKSGTTTEPAVAFRIIRNHLEKKYGKAGARQRIFAVTDASRGALKHIAGTESYTTYVIPDDVGGRYSVLTPVGLLPIAVGGLDINALMEGALAMEEIALETADFEKNPSALYAALRNNLYRLGKVTEIMVTYEPGLVYFTEWWKQLFGESEGKEGKGIFPAGVTFTTDLHSMGQYIQEGARNIFETILSTGKSRHDLIIPNDPDDIDGLNFLAGKSLEEVNRQAELGTRMAHVDGKVPNIRITIPCLNEKNLGQLIYFFEFACALSGYMLGVNPFDQPGVEAYKRNMFALLGKPGY